MRFWETPVPVSYTHLYEKHHGVIITDEGVKAAVNLSTRYINDRFLHDKAIDLMDEAAARIRLKNLTSSDELLALKKEITDKQNQLENALSKGDLAAAGALMSEKEVLENKQQKLIRKNRRTGAKNQPVVGENEIADVEMCIRDRHMTGHQSLAIR